MQVFCERPGHLRLPTVLTYNIGLRTRHLLRTHRTPSRRSQLPNTPDHLGELREARLPAVRLAAIRLEAIERARVPYPEVEAFGSASTTEYNESHEICG